MLKDTSLLLAIPVGTELFFQLQAIGNRTYQTFPVLVAATLYYLIASSVLMVGQAYLEKRFGRGFGVQAATDKPRGSQRPGHRGSQVSTATAATTHLVHALNVTKSFGTNEVLKGVDLTVDPGEVVCLLGPSGSGKTTFLRLINQMEILTGGRIWVGGELIGIEERKGKLHIRNDKDIARQRSRIGMVFQRFNLFPHMTALENVMEAPIQVKRLAKSRRPAGGAEAAGHGRAGRPGQVLPCSAVRRPAAAGRDRAGPGHEAGADALRRADVRARSRTGRRGARASCGPWPKTA